MQQTLFGDIDNTPKTIIKPRPKPKIELTTEQPLIKQPLSYSEEYCIKQVLEEDYLWDLRCWHKDHDIDEVKIYLQALLDNIEDWKNCGHTIMCARHLLIDYGKSIDEVTELFMRNHHIQYRNELGSSYICSKCGQPKPSDISMWCEACHGGEDVN